MLYLLILFLLKHIDFFEQMMESTLTAAAATLKQNPNLIEAVGNMWDNLTELSKSDPEKYQININCFKDF